MHLHPARIALAALIALIVVAWASGTVIRRSRLRALYHLHFGGGIRERLLLASLGFYVAFAVVRILTHAIHAGSGRVHNIEMRGLHIHHLVWGILLLLVVGYGWLLAHSSRWAAGLLSLLYGIAAALTLDEFALWLNLRDVYWEREGRASLEALFFFAGLLAIGILGAPFLRAVGRGLFNRSGR